MKYTTITLMLPSRGRVACGWLPRFVQSARATCDCPDRVRYVLLADRDDQPTIDYACSLSRLGFNARLVLSSTSDGQPHIARFFNEMYATDQDPASLVTMMGDDMSFRTRGWDTMILDEVNRRDGWALVYGDDDYVQHERMAVHFFTTRKVVEATGMPFMWERWRANIIDFVWTEVARRCGILRYLPEVHIAHLHAGKQPDETYHRMDPFRQFASGKHAPEIEAYIQHVAERLQEAMRNGQVR